MLAWSANATGSWMSIRVRVATKLGLVVMVCDGVVSADDLERHLVPLIEKPEYSLMPLALVDLTAADRFEGSSEVIRRNARRAAQFIDDKVGRGSRMAIVAPRDEFFGLGRMYEMLRAPSPVEFRVFRAPGEAERWLGLPGGYASELTDVL
jgi:hypothetical protein